MFARAVPVECLIFELGWSRAMGELIHVMSSVEACL